VNGASVQVLVQVNVTGLKNWKSSEGSVLEEQQHIRVQILFMGCSGFLDRAPQNTVYLYEQIQKFEL